MNYPTEFETLFAAWKQDACFTKQTGNEYFAKDGIVCPEQWAKEKVKLLFLLNETHGSSNDLLQYLYNTKGGEGATWHNVVRWANLLLDGEPFSGDFYTDDALNVCRRIAVMNLKKTPGAGRIDKKTFVPFVQENREYIRREIELISPALIVCGGNWRFVKKYIFSDCNFRSEIQSGIKGYWQHCEVHPGMVAVNFYHPAQTRYSIERLKNEVLLIRAKLVAQTPQS